MQRKGSLEQFENTALPYLNAAYNLARWLTQNPHDAQDVVQESYLRALRSFDSFRAGCDARAWLLTIVRNTCFTWLRQNRPACVAAEFDENIHDAPENWCNPETVLLEKADSKLLNDEIAALPYEYREVLILREFEGLSYKQVAQVVGVPLGTVMSRLARARRNLQRRLCGAQTEAQA